MHTPQPCDYEDTEVSEIRDSDTDPGYEDDDPWADYWDSGAWADYWDSGAWDAYDDDDDLDMDEDSGAFLSPAPMRTPTPMDEDVPTSRRGRDYDGERDELYRDRLLAEGHVIYLERSGDWSTVMGHEVQAL